MKKGSVKWIIIGLGAVLALLVLFLLVWDAHGVKQRRIRSERFGYIISYDENQCDFETVKLDEKPTYMERVFLKSSPYSNYVTVSAISAETDLDEVLTAFQSDGSYRFDDRPDATFGSGAYHARKISYTDQSGDNDVQVDYYVLSDRRLLVAAAYDEDHRDEIAEILNSFELE